MTNTNPWKHVDAGDISNNPYFKKISNKENPVSDQNSPASESSNIMGGTYTQLPKADTYAVGVVALRTQLNANPSNAHPQFILPNGSSVYRPLTFRENIEARIIDYNRDKNIDGSKRTDAQKLELFNTWIDSCTGIAYKKKTKLFKISPICGELITIDNGFNSAFLPVDYSKFSGNELDSSMGVYNQDLSLSQVLVHPAWIAALEDDKALLKEYAGITFNILKTKYSKEEGMGFYVRSDTTKDELRALYVNLIGSDSSAIGYDNLSDYARFLLVAPAKKI